MNLETSWEACRHPPMTFKVYAILTLMLSGSIGAYHCRKIEGCELCIRPNHVIFVNHFAEMVPLSGVRLTAIMTFSIQSDCYCSQIRCRRHENWFRTRYADALAHLKFVMYMVVCFGNGHHSTWKSIQRFIYLNQSARKITSILLQRVFRRVHLCSVLQMKLKFHCQFQLLAHMSLLALLLPYLGWTRTHPWVVFK